LKERKKILITSGPTRAPLDAIRFLSNSSSGRFGTLLAREALLRGAEVTFVYGRGSEFPRSHPRLKLVPIETHRDLVRRLRSTLGQVHYDAIIHAMAVLDFEPASIRKGKVGSQVGEWRVRLVPTSKIIPKIRQWAPEAFLVGFKLEVGLTRTSLLQRARRLLRESGADLVVANQLGSGDDERHLGYLLDHQGRLILKVRGKKGLSREIIRSVL